MPSVMGMDATTRASAKSILDAALSGTLTEDETRRLYALGPEAVDLVALAMTRRAAELEDADPHASTPDPSMPSGQVPNYTKPRTGKRGKRPGGQAGRARPATGSPHEHGPSSASSTAALPALRREAATLEPHPNPDHRGHSRIHHPGGHRTYDPSRLLSAMQEARRAGGAPSQDRGNYHFLRL
jgi:hypothetical protein